MIILTTALSLPRAVSGADETWTRVDLDEIASVQAKVEEHAGTFTVSTIHYVVRAEVDARFTAELACYLERFDAAANAILDLPPMENPARAEVTVYASQLAYQQHLGKNLQSRGQFDWVFPYNGDRPRYTIQTFVANQRERTFTSFCLPILNHEATHYLLQLRAGPNHIPNAIHEGVATYMQSWNFFRSSDWNRGHHVSAFLGDLKRAVLGRSLPSISLLSVASTWDVDNFGPLTNTRYASAESFVAFLLGDSGRKQFFSRLLREALHGGNIHRLLVERAGASLEEDWRDSLAHAFSG